jgi:2-polyprenyl-3-methyl-5-hydroxy-6-metoxy-1,4-benzoquinol methylase
MKAYDDYNWDTYTTDDYESQVFNTLTQKDGLDLIIKNFKRDSLGELVFEDNLHDNWKEVYHFVDKFNVNSVYECGCGSGQHLINLRIINPKLLIEGSDYSQSQIDLGKKYLNLSNYDIQDKLYTMDMTKDLPNNIGKFDFVFTQAVTMHLRHSKALEFLKNMGKLSNKYILLIENINAHNYPNLIKESLPDFEIVNEKKYINNTIILKRKI